CITDADCPSSSCKTFIQPCPICNATTNVCNGGPNRGLTCTPGDSIPNGDYPTSHDCPPPPPNFLGAPPIALVLASGTISTPGAFTANDLARTIVEQGAAAGPLMTGGAAAPETLVSIFCIQPTFNALVDAGYDLPGPGAVALSGTTQLQ